MVNLAGKIPDGASPGELAQPPETVRIITSKE